MPPLLCFLLNSLPVHLLQEVQNIRVLRVDLQGLTTEIPGEIEILKQEKSFAKVKEGLLESRLIRVFNQHSQHPPRDLKRPFIIFLPAKIERTDLPVGFTEPQIDADNLLFVFDAGIECGNQLLVQMKALRS